VVAIALGLTAKLKALVLPFCLDEHLSQFLVYCFDHGFTAPVAETANKAAEPMTTLNEFKTLRASVSPEVQADLFRLFTSDPESSFQRMVEIAAEKGVTLTVEEVKGFLKQMDEDDEFDDIELDAVALVAIAGGNRGRNGGCLTHDFPHRLQSTP